MSFHIGQVKGGYMKVLGFGEILWDVFGERKTIGGAPLNLLGHIRKLGGQASIISAVGDDDLGTDSIDAIDKLGIERKYLKISEFETGKAVISLEDGIPSYSFNYPAAWDDISFPQEKLSEIVQKEYSVFIYGSLAQRSPTSRNTLTYLLDNIKADEFFFDVNLRLDFWSKETILNGLRKATILKMNDEEVPLIANCLGVPEAGLYEYIFNEFSVSRIVVTRGKKGAECHEKGMTYKSAAANCKVIDTVGAGDSLSAGFIYFLLCGCSTQEALNKAAILADYVVTKHGAIPDYDDELLERLKG